MWDAFQFEFMRNALTAGLLASIACGIIGTLVVVNRIVFMAGGIAHAAYGGIGLAFYFGWPHLYGTLGVSVAAASLMAWITEKMRHRVDTIVGVLWALGMAMGVILVDLSPGYNVDLMSYLFGSILTVPAGDVTLMAVMTGAILLLIGIFYRQFVALSYDAEFAQLRGVPVRLLYWLLMVMISLSVVMVIRVVGLILVIALLTIGPYIAESFCSSLLGMMGVSILLNGLFTVTGLAVAYAFNLTSGATIILVSSAAFFLSMLLKRVRRLLKHRPVETSEDTCR